MNKTSQKRLDLLQIVHYFNSVTTNQYDEILHNLKLESIYYSRSSFGGEDWSIHVPGYENTSMFHVLISGNCIVNLNNTKVDMAAGDVLFIPRAIGHDVMGSEEAKNYDLYSLPVNKVSDLYETLNLNIDEQIKTILLCGVVKVSHPSGVMLLSEMPELVHIKREEHLFNSLVEGIVEVVFQEASGNLLGGESVITRLADILLIQSIRYWVATADEHDSQWLNALKDPQIGNALSSIHKSPHEQWTIDRLGKTIGMSRTAFAVKFNELVGDSPMHYLTTWRMNLAELRIKNGEKVSLDMIESLGYQSESSFRRAFKKNKGYTLSQIPISSRTHSN